MSTSGWRGGESVDLYELLERIAPSPIHTLNKAIAVAQWKGPEAGLELIESQKPPGWILGYYLWDAAVGELKRQSGDFAVARQYLSRACDSAPTVAERELLQRRIAACEAEDVSRE